MKKKYLISILGTSLLTLTSCNDYISNFQKIICPSGAPALGLVQLAGRSNGIVFNSKPTNVSAELLQDNYGCVVFDFFSGLKIIKNSNAKDSRKKSDYKLWRIITGGNLYLLGINKNNDDRPQEGDYIVSFGEGNLPDLVFKDIFSDLLATESITVDYVAGVTEIAPIIKSGAFQNKPVDYVVVAEPVLTKAVATGSQSYASAISLSALWDNQPIPQAGLFIHNEMYKAYAEYFNNRYVELNSYIKASATDEGAEEIASYMQTRWPNVDDQKDKFGFDASTVRDVQIGKNGFAIMENAIWGEDVDINAFLTKLGISEDYSEYIVDPTPLINND